MPRNFQKISIGLLTRLVAGINILHWWLIIRPCERSPVERLAKAPQRDTGCRVSGFDSRVEHGMVSVVGAPYQDSYEGVSRGIFPRHFCTRVTATQEPTSVYVQPFLISQV